MNARHLIVITDLDGTLLDSESYQYDASLPAVRMLQARKIPLVLCSSKTRREIVRLWRELGLRDPFICENGGAICFPPDYFPFPVDDAPVGEDLSTIILGSRVAELRNALIHSRAGLDVKVRSFGEMDADEVSALTGLASEQASLALKREYDEPFTVEGRDTDRLFENLRARGLTVTFGGRLYHVTGGHDKGRAVRRLITLYRRSDPACLSVGLGNSANDLPLLHAVDHAMLIRNTDGSYDDEVLRALPRIEKTEERGPAGWNTAISRILADQGA